MPKRVGQDRVRERHFLREWRKYRGLNQEELAYRTGQSNANLSRIERMEQPYTQDFLEIAAEVLKTDKVSILTRNPQDPDSFDVASEYASAPPSFQDVVKSILRNRREQAVDTSDIDLSKVKQRAPALLREVEPVERSRTSRKIEETSNMKLRTTSPGDKRVRPLKSRKVRSDAP
jgi:transcriptional regulator with XRE-family HTH domain